MQINYQQHVHMEAHTYSEPVSVNPAGQLCLVLNTQTSYTLVYMGFGNTYVLRTIEFHRISW